MLTYCCYRKRRATTTAETGHCPSNYSRIGRTMRAHGYQVGSWGDAHKYTPEQLGITEEDTVIPD